MIFISGIMESVSAAMSMITGTFSSISNWWIVLYAVAMFTVSTAIGVIGTIVNRNRKKGGRRR